MGVKKFVKINVMQKEKARKISSNLDYQCIRLAHGLCGSNKMKRETSTKSQNQTNSEVLQL